MTSRTYHPPMALKTKIFSLRPIRAADAGLDYEAVMESRAFLRTWEQSGWPADDFTEDENRKDLENLERRHAAGEAFTYTLMNPVETRCLGCVYIIPIDTTLFTRSEISSVNGARWTDGSAAVYFWVRKAELHNALDRELLETLGPWLKDEWRLPLPFYITNEQFGQQVSMMEAAGLRLEFRIDDPKAEGNFLAYVARNV